MKSALRLRYSILVFLVLSAVWTSCETREEKLMAPVIEAYRASEYEDCLSLIEWTLQQDSSISDAYLFQGRSFDKVGETRFAERAFLTGLELSPRDFELHQALVDHYIVQEDYSAAMALLDKRVAESQDRALALRNRANIKFEIEQYDLAFNDYRESLALRSNHRAWLQLGWCCVNSENDLPCDSLIPAMLTATDHDAEGLYIAGAHAMRQERYDESISLFQACIDQEPEGFFVQHALHELAVAFRHKGEYTKAFSHAFRLADLKPRTQWAIDLLLVTTCDTQNQSNVQRVIDLHAEHYHPEQTRKFTEELNDCFLNKSTQTAP